jgi:glycosyltransferase involved in cell wall biosynthesis
MIFYIVIPAYNEETHLAKTLNSLCEQTLLPTKIVVVNDNSTDKTQDIAKNFSKRFEFISHINTVAEASHQPGSKVINAFNKGFKTLDENYDVICKFDADLIFPNDYLERISEIFRKNPECGMAGGFCYIHASETWKLENLTNKDHIRGALKAYRKECFQQINGLQNTMGWDTVDELLARYHGWEICTDESLHVKHLKPTGGSYAKNARFKQGEAFYKLRYGLWLTLIATGKLAFRKKSIPFFINTMRGYFKAKKNKLPYLVSKEEGNFIRDFRWKNIKKKLGLT